MLEEAEKSVAILDPLEPLRNNADTWRRAALWYESKGDEPSLKRALQLLERCRAIVAAQAAEARRNPLATEATDPILAGPGEVDRLIAALQVRMGNPGAAMEALTRGVEQEPENAEAWSQYAEALAASGRHDDAVVAAMEGVMLTVDPALRQRVVDLYRAGGAASGCALLPGQNGSVAINPACPAVRQQLCTATARAIAVRRKSGRQDLAEQLRASGVRDFGCDPKTLE